MDQEKLREFLLKHLLNSLIIAIISKIAGFFLATGNHEEELEILNKILGSANGGKCEKLNHLKINETLPIIKNCNIAICNDSSFSHLSAALNIPTIVLMADTPFALWEL